MGEARKEALRVDFDSRIKLSCHDFVDNQVRLQLFALAYNLGNFLRRLVLPARVEHSTPPERGKSPKSGRRNGGGAVQ